jgi:hypothetical protein
MDAIQNWNGKLSIPGALQRSHDDARVVFVRAAMQSDRIANAGKYLAQLCLPHFEFEEKEVFPVLALLPYLEQGNLRSEMLAVVPHIDDIRAKRNAIFYDHQSILAAVEELRQVAHKEKNREITEFAHNMHVQVRIEDEVIYSAVILIGKHLEGKFAG